MHRLTLILVVTSLIYGVAVRGGEIDYLRDVKPLLEHKCYACHGALKQQAELRLDTAVSILQGGQSGPAVVPQKPAESLLMQVITGEAGFRMPPANEGSPLNDQEREIIRQWIAAGAVAPADEHPQTDPRSWWSYQPVSRPTQPQVANPDWCRSSIDYFVASRRAQNTLGHVAEATRPEWLRRVYLDLIGLPPTRSELQYFLADNSPKAYEAVVEDLLARPQYGERWGRHWMDVWRYSDWYGSRGSNEIRYSQRHIWRWRDWIIASLNNDKGYDQMVREMLAADELAGKDKDTVVATGYLGRNWYKFDRNVRLFETVERTSEAFLGLTLRCARCHDHKYDPVTQEEYYGFRAFFEPQYVRTDRVSALTETEKDATLGEVLSDGLPIAFDLEHGRPTYRFKRGDDRFPDESKIIEPAVPASFGGPPLNIQPVNLPAEVWYPILRKGVRESLLIKAHLELQEAEAALAQTEEKADEIAHLIADFERAPKPTDPAESVFLHDNFSKPRPEVWETLHGNWTYEDGALVLKEATSFATIATKENHPRDFTVHLTYKALKAGSYRSIGFSYDFIDTGTSQDVYTSTGDTKQTVQAFHRVAGKQTYPREGIIYLDLELNKLVTLDVTVKNSFLTIDLDGERKLEYELPIARQDGKFSLWVHSGTAEFHELNITALTESLETLERRQRSAIQDIGLARKQVQLAKAKQDSVQARLNATVAELISPTDDLPKLRKTAAAAELKVVIEKAEHEILRLSHQAVTAESQKAREAATNQLIDAKAALSNPGETFEPLGTQHPKTSTGRRSALARWITDNRNPRTARIAANHIWGRHFGAPLVATTENFGLNGKRPTHPRLLDWLAAELMENDWRMKPLHRQIVLSATYRMSTQANSQSDSLADTNNQYFWRMNSRRMEAEVVRDSMLYLSGQLDLSRGGPEIPETSGETVLRRSLYFRNTPNEKMGLLEVFDLADPNSCYRRKESVVPHQSLAIMNSGLALDSARLIARELAAIDGDFVTMAFETLLSRRPTSAETERCEKFLGQHTKLLGEKPTEYFKAGGSAQVAPASDPAVRARENLVHVLLLHNDFVTVR
ncbi:MAG: DUF1553 domain-containing protein [Pirellulaceae bacterium]|nr:DUF1553 domain-containing protein [Pirellulaceae bacterium]